MSCLWFLFIWTAGDAGADGESRLSFEQRLLIDCLGVSIELALDVDNRFRHPLALIE